MVDDPILARSNTLIAGRYAVDTAQSLPDAGGGLPAFVAWDRQVSGARLAALAVSRDASPRVLALSVLGEPAESLMVPLAHGIAPLAAGKGYFVICSPPPGPPISTGLNLWPEKALLDLVLRPAAQVLDYLYRRKLTHRAIRPNNVFQPARGQPVTLGAAWAAPPAMHQPAVFESPYTAMCEAAGRGDGTIADDVYALGVLLLALSSGRLPMANMDDAAVIRWKLDLGSFAALTRDMTVPVQLAELLRGMLAEDPDHRPLPAQLLDLAKLRGRRVAARPPRRSQTALTLNDMAVFDSRTLAYALFRDEKRAIQFLRNGLISQWLRRGVGDAGLATRIEDLVRNRIADTKSGPLGDPLLVMHTIAVLNPRMPLCWRGFALWPDALAAVLAQGVAANAILLAVAGELLAGEIANAWSDQEPWRPVHPDMTQHRRLFQGEGTGGLLRLFYTLNPLLPNRIAGMAMGWVLGMADLMHFLESAAEKAGDSVIDPHTLAFIVARSDRKTETFASTLAGAKGAAAIKTAELVLLEDLQTRYYPVPMPALAKWAAARLRPDLIRWHNRPRREAMDVRLDALAQTGFISRLLAVTEDLTARAADIAGARLASNELLWIDAEIAAMDRNGTARKADSERSAQAIAGGIGLSVFVLMAMSVLLR